MFFGGMKMLEVTNLSKHFGKVKAVDRINFAVGKGEIFGLLGANGAGKTTTLRTLATMLKPTEGTARVAGYDIADKPDEARQNIGLLFGGDTGLYDRLSAQENIVYFAELNGMSTSEAIEKTKELARAFSFTEYLNTWAGKLSKGTRQKVAFSRSIIHNPAVMLFDEPTVGLDVTAKSDVMDFILKCRSEGKCIVLSDHTLSVIERLCDRVGIMKQGALLGVGTIPELCGIYGCSNLEEVFFKLAGERNAE
jgi:sodium transport system ATP-binding protein